MLLFNLTSNLNINNYQDNDKQHSLLKIQRLGKEFEANPSFWNDANLVKHFYYLLF